MIRFKKDDGSNYPQLMEKMLGDIYQFQYGQFNNNPDNGVQYPIYGANGVIGGYTDYNAKMSVIIGHMGAYAGSVLWEEGKHFVTYNGTIAKPNDEDKTDAKYGYYMLLSKDIIKICAGSGQPFLAYNTLNKIKLLYPSDIEEQRKIANLLSDIDNVISTSEQEVANLEEQKKGAMQKIFSQEVRFKADDGSEYPDWKEKRIRDLFDIAAGGDIDKENSSDIKSEEFCYPVYANALVNNGLYGYANYYKIDGDTLTITGRGDVGHAVARHESYVPIVNMLFFIIYLPLLK